MEFEIGNRVKIEGDSGIRYSYPDTNNFLIIGKNQGFYIILYTYSSSFEICKEDIQNWGINSKYLGYRGICVAASVVKPLGKVCYLCQSYFDYLDESVNFMDAYDAYKVFVCWKCEV